MTIRGKFITFEGCEGTGKSTQIKLLSERLNKIGIPHITTREPGGTEFAEAMRAILLSGKYKISPKVETFLFAAARADHVETVIEPSLRAGKWVLCDRFIESTHAYQGAHGVNPSVIFSLEYAALRVDATDKERNETTSKETPVICRPDLTLVFDMPVADGLRRASQRRGNEIADRFEQEKLDFHIRASNIFLERARANEQHNDYHGLPHPYKVIWVHSYSVEQVQKLVRQAVQTFIQNQGFQLASKFTSCHNNTQEKCITWKR
jgi:dTMP kinase